MRGTILIIDHYDYTFCSGDLADLAISEGFDEFAFAYALNVDEALEIFFDQPPALIIANRIIPGIQDALKSIKAEEIYRHVPVIIVVEKYGSDIYRKAYQVGADAVLTYKEVEQGHLVLRARPLLVNSALFQIKIKRASELEEKNLMDFILLDLIRPYVSRSIWNIAQKYAEQQKIQIAARETELVIAFGDIKSFASTAERMKPAQVIDFLNDSYEIVTRHIYNNGGDIDKFIGDAFFAVFDDSASAIRSMASIQKEMTNASMNNSSSQDNDHVNNSSVCVRFRIAVHVGRVIRGNVGGHDRFDNTLIGGAVNLCSRLEHQAPVGGLLVSEEAGLKAGIQIPSDKMLIFSLRGLEEETRAFSFFDMVDQGLIESKEWLS